MDPFDWLVEPTSEFIETQNKVRTEEEIKKYALDENLSETQKYNHLLQKGFPIQKLSVILNLPRIFTERPDSFPDIFYSISKNLSSWEIDIQRQAADTLKEMLERGMLTASNHSRNLAQLVFKMLKQPRPEIIEKWTSLFAELLNHAEISCLETDCFDFITEITSVDQENEALRSSGVVFIGALCKRYIITNKLPSEILDRFNLLLQDHSWAIRREMCEYIVTVCKALGQKRTSAEMIPEIVELFHDDMEEVTIGVFESVIDLFPMTTDDDLTQHLIPEYLKFLSEISNKKAIPVAKKIGELIYAIDGRVSDQTLLQRCIEIFVALPQRTDAEERRLCAYNVPAVTFCLKEEYFHTHLKQLLENLAKDEVVEVKQTLAAGIHEVFKIFGGTEVPEFLKDILYDIADSDDAKVTQGVAEHLSEIVFSFVNQRYEDTLCLRESQKPAVQDFTEFITNMIPRVQSNWRTHQRFLENIGEVIKYFPAEDIRNSFGPILITALHTGAVPLKITAAEIMALTLNRIHLADLRESLAEDIVHEFAASALASDRAAYMEFCIKAAETFSRERFKKSFLTPLLKLSKEKIPNMRYKFCRCLKVIRGKYLDLDYDLDQKIHDILSKLVEDDDQDVREIAEDIQFSFMDDMSSGHTSESNKREERLLEEEEYLKDAENKEREEQKKRDLEHLANQARQEYLLNLAANQKSPRGGGGARGKAINFINKKRHSEVYSRPQGIGAARSPAFLPRSRPDGTSLTMADLDYNRSPILGNSRKSISVGSAALKAAGKSIGGGSLPNSSPRLKKKKSNNLSSPVTILAASKRDSLLLSAAGVESLKKNHGNSDDHRVISRMKPLKNKRSSA